MNAIEYVIVGRQQVPKSEAACIDCKKPFKFGVNIFTKEGHKEVTISGLCETCFDSIFLDLDDEGVDGGDHV